MAGDKTGYSIRIDPRVLEQIEKKAKSVLPAVPNSDGQAWYALGIQRVLDILRTDITIGA